MTNPSDLLTYIMIWFLLAILGAAMLGRFNKAGIGFLLGLFLGPLGIVIAFGIRDHEKSKQDKAEREAADFGYKEEFKPKQLRRLK